MVRRFAILAALMLAAVSCVYPFEPDVEGAGDTLVIEGDILIGEECTFNVSRTTALGKRPDSKISGTKAVFSTPGPTVWVEDSNGGKYTAKEGTTTVDLTNASSDLQYRLNVQDNSTGRYYHSEFKPVIKAADIDSLCYIMDRSRNQLNIGLSMHTAGSHYFRWSYREVWEYTAHYYSRFKYIVDDVRLQRGHLEPYENGENIYYCWRNDASKEIMVFSTADQTEDRFVDLEFHSIPRSDQRIMDIYFIEVFLEPMDEMGYKFWNNLRETSDNQGGFFSPTPSQMAGNIVCDTDPGEFVIGYINVAQRSKEQLYYYDNKHHFYEPTTRYWPDLEVVPESDWYLKYSVDLYLPIEEAYDETGTEVIGYYWAPRDCSDCRYGGGTKNKPDWWPSDHI